MNKGENKTTTSEDPETRSAIVSDAADLVELTEDETTKALAPDDIMFLAAIQDAEKRQEVILILRSAGLLAS